MKVSGLLLLALCSLLRPFATAQSLPPDSGLLITRINSEQWQIRLIAGSTSQQFSGIIESDLPIMAVRSTGKSSDGAKLLTATSLGAILSVSPGGVDGVNFSASADAKLCLRDTGSSGAHIYLGNSLVDAVPVAAPLALSSADACGDATSPMLGASARKYHPGHYTIIVNGIGWQSFMTAAMQQPGMVGIVRRYSWRSLEPTQGVYNFSVIKSDLAWAAGLGAQLVVVITYKTVNGEKDGPAYLDGYESRNKLGGYALELWSPVVVARYNALIKALGAQVDSISNFEGLGNQESALSVDSATLKTLGYTPEKYRDALINMLSAATVSMPSSRVFWYMNFLEGNQSYIGTIATAVSPLGVVMGGPDDWPDNQSLETKAYPYYTQFAGKMPLFIQVEGVNYAEPHMTSGYATKDWTMLELYQFALTKLHVNYMFWLHTPRPVNAAAYDWFDALPVIAAHPTLN